MLIALETAMTGVRVVAGIGRRLWRSACAAVFEHGCVLCGGRLADGWLCAGCERDLPRIAHACPRCGEPQAAPVAPGLACARCLLRPPPFRAARAALLYAFPVDSALKALKFDGRLYYAPAFAGLMRGALAAHFGHVDALLPVPLHPRRHAVRGFNQALELARPLARHSGLPLVTCTRRVRNTAPQTGLSAAARRRNLRHAFAVQGTLPCCHPLIVDDVMTTGETCAQFAATLLAAGARDVSVLTAARAAPPP